MLEGSSLAAGDAPEGVGLGREALLPVAIAPLADLHGERAEVGAPGVPDLSVDLGHRLQPS